MLLASRGASLRRTKGKAFRPPVTLLLAAGGSPGAAVHHLRRVHQPVPTAKHPLAGLWAMESGGGSMEILRVVYDFSGSSARIVATKVGVSARAGSDGLAAVSVGGCRLQHAAPFI